MAFTQKIDIGYPIAVVQSQVYALPSKAVTMFNTQSVNIANDIGMTSPQVVAAVTGTAVPIKISGGFIQCTAATNCTITLKAD